MNAKTKTARIVTLLFELGARRCITLARAAKLLGESHLTESTWKRYKKELEAFGCKLTYDAKTHIFHVPKGWTLTPPTRMDPRKRDVLVRLRVDLPRLGPPFTEILGPQLEQWEMQIAQIDPDAVQLAPARQPQPRANATFYANLAACETAVRERRVLHFTYRRSADGKVSERHILPYDMYDHDGRIYVWGPEEGGDVEKFFALDRMTDAQVLDEFAATKEFDPGRSLDDALRHSFGIYITKDKVREIVVKVAQRRAADVRARRWPAEKSIEAQPDGSVIVKFAVSDPREVVGWVLSFGGDAKVLSPPEAAEMARRFAENIHADHKWAENAPVDERFMSFDWSDSPD